MRRPFVFIIGGLIVFPFLGSGPASAEPPVSPGTLFGSGTYTPATGGYRSAFFPPFNPGSPLNNSEVAIGSAEKWSPANTPIGQRAMRWDTSGAPATELGNLGMSATSVTNTGASAINNAGVIVGSAELYDANGANLGARPVYWDASNTAIMFPVLGTSSTGFTQGRADHINSAGVAVGFVNKYNAAGTPQGPRAVRWNVGAVAPIELPSPDSAVTLQGFAYAMNDDGVVVGQVRDRAVRWDSANNPTALGNLSVNGEPLSTAYEVNAAGTTVGQCKRYGPGGEDLGVRAVRWSAANAAAEELRGVGTDPEGISVPAAAVGINDSDKIIGYGQELTSTGQLRGVHALWWDNNSANPHILPRLSTAPDGTFESRAHAVNSFGTIVGYSGLFAPDGSGTAHATYWSPDGAIHDLNALIDPSSGWVLHQAVAIDDNHWVSGLGSYDPDGPGGQQAYSRLFLVAIPEPATLSAILVAMTALAVSPGARPPRR